MTDNHPARQNWDENRIVLQESGDGYTAWCSPDARGSVYLGETEVGDRRALDQNGAPFPFDIVFHDALPGQGTVTELEKELGEAFSDQFDGKVDDVYETIEESDDPIATIMDLDPDDL